MDKFKVKTPYILLIAELIFVVVFIYPINHDIKFSIEVVFYIFYVLLCMINFGLLLLVYISHRKNIKAWLMLFLIIFAFGPIYYAKNIFVEDMKARYRDNSYVMRMNDALIPFYQGDGTKLEKRIQGIRIGITSNLTNVGRNSSGLATVSSCPNLVRSFVTPDMHYIILTCLNSQEQMVSYQAYIEPCFDKDNECKAYYAKPRQILPLSQYNNETVINEYIDDVTGRRFGLLQSMQPNLVILDEGVIPPDAINRKPIFLFWQDKND